MTVIVFVADGCPHCQGLVEDLERRRVSFRVVDVLADAEGFHELARVTRERCVPVLVDHERCSIGFRGEATALDALTEERLAILASEGGVPKG